MEKLLLYKIIFFALIGSSMKAMDANADQDFTLYDESFQEITFNQSPDEDFGLETSHANNVCACQSEEYLQDNQELSAFNDMDTDTNYINDNVANQLPHNPNEAQINNNNSQQNNNVDETVAEPAQKKIKLTNSDANDEVEHTLLPVIIQTLKTDKKIKPKATTTPKPAPKKANNKKKGKQINQQNIKKRKLALGLTQHNNPARFEFICLACKKPIRSSNAWSQLKNQARIHVTKNKKCTYLKKRSLEDLDKFLEENKDKFKMTQTTSVKSNSPSFKCPECRKSGIEKIFISDGDHCKYINRIRSHFYYKHPQVKFSTKTIPEVI